MADLAKESLEIWQELEKDADTSLRMMTGLLNFGDETMGNKTAEGEVIRVLAAQTSADEIRWFAGSNQEPRKAWHGVQEE